jgi:hypothetical protein
MIFESKVAALCAAIKPIQVMVTGAELPTLFSQSGFGHFEIVEAVDAEKVGRTLCGDFDQLLEFVRTHWAKHLEAMVSQIEQWCPPWEVDEAKDFRDSVTSLTCTRFSFDGFLLFLDIFLLAMYLFDGFENVIRLAANARVS